MRNMAKEQDREEAKSILGLPEDIARTRVKMAKEAARGLDAASLEWLCGPGGLRGFDWVCPDLNEWRNQSIFNKTPSVWECLCQALRAKPEAVGAEDRALRGLRALIGSGLSLNDEARATQGGDALRRGLSLVAPFPGVKIKSALPTAAKGRRHGGGSGAPFEMVRKKGEVLTASNFLEVYGREAMLSMGQNGMTMEAALATWQQSLEEAKRHQDLSENGPMMLFLSGAKNGLSELAAKELLGDAAQAETGSVRGAAKRL